MGIKENKRIKANINDKDVIEDWYFLTDGEELCYRNGNARFCVFENNGCIWKISYVYGKNTFKMNCIDHISHDNFEISYRDLRERISDFNDPSVELLVLNETMYSCEYGFFVRTENNVSEENPYKVGDKVYVNGRYARIDSINIYDNILRYSYSEICDNGYCCGVCSEKDIKPYNKQIS